MILKTEKFYDSYKSFYQLIRENVKSDMNVLEVGGGAHPSLQNRMELSYTIADPDREELNKSPEDIIKIYTSMEELDHFNEYDLILSKMVLEHVEDPTSFHKKTILLLKPGGSAIHFFACRNSIPAFANRVLPEWFGEWVLKVLKNRNITDNPKYKAYYRRTYGHRKSQIEFFTDLGYIIEAYYSYVGHKYFTNIIFLSQLERMYTALLNVLNLHKFATVAIVVLKKPESND